MDTYSVMAITVEDMIRGKTATAHMYNFTEGLQAVSDGAISELVGCIINVQVRKSIVTVIDCVMSGAYLHDIAANKVSLHIRCGKRD